MSLEKYLFKYYLLILGLFKMSVCLFKNVSFHLSFRNFRYISYRWSLVFPFLGVIHVSSSWSLISVISLLCSVHLSLASIHYNYYCYLVISLPSSFISFLFFMLFCLLMKSVMSVCFCCMCEVSVFSSWSLCPVASCFI